MPALKYNGYTFEGHESETVLDCLIRNGQVIPNSCRGGVCQSCTLKTTSGADAIAQKGLSTPKKESGLFLSCQQRLTKDFEVTKPAESDTQIVGQILSQERVSKSVVIITIRLASPLTYHAGQFVNIIRDDNLSRSYSIASVSNDRTIKFHVRKMPGGVMSSWLYDTDLIGEMIKINGPIGECYLTQEMFNDDLLLLGVGTGLAPLFGIILDALAKDFKNKIRLYHGGLTLESLYLVEELKNLENKFEQFSYSPVYLKGDERLGFIKGDMIELLQESFIDKFNTTVMVCGDPDMVKKLKQTVFMKGVSSKKILSDSFVAAKPKS
jgi:NAD(P)H-flavin reductase